MQWWSVRFPCGARCVEACLILRGDEEVEVVPHLVQRRLRQARILLLEGHRDAHLLERAHGLVLGRYNLLLQPRELHRVEEARAPRAVRIHEPLDVGVNAGREHALLLLGRDEGSQLHLIDHPRAVDVGTLQLRRLLGEGLDLVSVRVKVRVGVRIRVRARVKVRVGIGVGVGG